MVDPEEAQMSLLPETLRSKIVAEQRSARVDTPCWVWTGVVTSGGYGSAHVKTGLGTSLHRAVYKFLVGAIPDETLDHLCLVKRCVNPAHMEPVSYQENKRRGMAIKYPVCGCGRPYDSVVRSGYKDNVRRVCKDCRARWQREHRARKKAAIGDRGSEPHPCR